MQTQLQLNVEKIEQYLETLNRDMHFMTRMDVMNDIYSNDLDKRISYLLEDKKRDLNLEGDFYLLNTKGSLVASSNINASDNSFSNINRFIEVDVISKFDNEKIGTLVLDFSLKNFTKFFSNTDTRNYYINVDGKKNLYILKSLINHLKLRWR